MQAELGWNEGTAQWLDGLLGYCQILAFVQERGLIAFKK